MRCILLISVLCPLISGFAGCTAHSVPAPSTAGVQGAIDTAQRYNDLAHGSAGRIDAKAAVIEKYWDSSK